MFHCSGYTVLLKRYPCSVYKNARSYLPHFETVYQCFQGFMEEEGLMGKVLVQLKVDVRDSEILQHGVKVTMKSQTKFA